MPKVFKSSNVIFDDSSVKINYKNRNNQTNINSNEDYIINEDIKEKLINQTKSAEDEKQQIILKAKVERDNILSNAQKIAENIIEDAKRILATEAAQTKLKSEEEGYKLGYEKGLNESLKIKEEANEIYKDIADKRENILKNVETEIIELILKITSKILNDSVKLDPSLILTLIKQGLNETTLQGDIFIRVSPEFYETVITNKQEILSMIDNSSKIDFIKDLSLKGPDCIIETPFGNIDSSLTEQVKSLKENLYLLLGDR